MSECSICLSLLKEPTYVVTQLTYLPKKYHEFIVSNVRRVYFDSTWQVNLQKELKSSKDKVKKLEQDKEILMRKCEDLIAAARAQAEGERAARDKADKLRQRILEQEQELDESTDHAQGVISTLEVEMDHLDAKYVALKERYIKLKEEHECVTNSRNSPDAREIRPVPQRKKTRARPASPPPVHQTKRQRQ
ncbi:hypothetical protein C0991_000524 [Blastosporella zonata]|nr:hypothetical protein C0991_000524 [Blastosporella zonata]